MTKGERIKQFREAIGMTQGELADRIKTTKQTVYKYEQNIVTNIPSDKIEEISKALGTTPQTLMGWDIPQSDTIPLTEQEQKLIDNYRSLNEEGKEKLLDLSDDLVRTGKYKKSAPDELVRKKA